MVGAMDGGRGCGTGDDSAGRDGSLVISCDDCAMQHTDTCDDCVVTFLCGREPDHAVVIDVAEARAVRMMSQAGLVPPLRRVAREG